MLNKINAKSGNNKYRQTIINFVCIILLMPLGKVMAQTIQPIRPLDLKQVVINDPFWTPKYKLWNTLTVYDVFDKLEGKYIPDRKDLIDEQKKLGKTRKSINAYKLAIQFVPDYLPSYKMLSFIYSKLEYFDTAVFVLDDAIKIDSTDIELYRRRGDVFHKQDYHFRCMPNYNKANQMGDSSFILIKKIALDLVSNRHGGVFRL